MSVGYRYQSFRENGFVARNPDFLALVADSVEHVGKHNPADVPAMLEQSWDGEWYRRAYFDDGTPLGSSQNEEGRIDSVAQSWAVLSGAAPKKRAERAMDAVRAHLVRRGSRVVLLLSPPFDRTAVDPGYIKGYIPGVRENGGQYTHGALWVVLANLMRGEGDNAAALLSLLNPISHSLTPEAARHYAVEPYVVAADVYAASPHTGRGGWTWYTGSASWFYRVALQYMLGFSIVAEPAETPGGTPKRFLVIDPCIPKRWPGFGMTFRDRDATYRIRVENPRGVNRGVARVTLDGAEMPDGRVYLDPSVANAGAHDLVVTLLGG